MIITKYEKWQMDLVTAAEVASSGLTEEEVVHRFGQLGEAEAAKKQENLRIECETWTAERWASLVEAFESAPLNNTSFPQRVYPDTPVERAYRRFINAADQLCEEFVDISTCRKIWDQQINFVESVAEMMRAQHDSGHLLESGSSLNKSLTTVVDLCQRGFDNFENQGTLFSDVLSLTGKTAAELRLLLSNAYA